ncbi:acyl-CoA dehydrogenase family protein [Paraliomyxa miuraensis]|uniref:acyl-CoA dehydrogenase family protein n=1 Tax=Paraliomyxa miuraensis TaxID=376150 RepID=UPI00224F5AF7|nr:acyl-CoA dehydrogenase family protein [Paraliomyxa miuraensis]MCX4243033.1 acyl-CoA/acyl-ACP dehydrogenase [Paraliomyxa miuraensis]
MHTTAKELERRFVAAAADWDAAQRIPDDVIRWCAEHGLLGACLPKRYAGTDCHGEQLQAMFESLGAVGGSLGSVVNVQHMVIRALMCGASDAQKDALLPALAAGGELASFCLTEPSAGSDIEGIEAACDSTPSGLRLRGTKRWITTGERATIFLVFARMNGAAVALLVPRSTPGVQVTPIRDVLGLRSAHLAQLDFDCMLPESAMVGKPGFALSFIAAQGLLHGRMNVAWMACGMLRATVEGLAHWASSRELFGSRLVDKGQVRAALTQMGVDLAAGRALAAQASKALAAKDATMSDRVLAAKYFCTRAAAQHTATAVRLCGAVGCHEPSGLARYYRDAKVFEVVEGANEVLEMLLGPAFAREHTNAT